jgi:hypothetical protein
VTPKLLKFDYKNWKGEEHTYVIALDMRDAFRMQFMKPGVLGREVSAEEMTWHVSGNVVTRDGDPRTEMGPTRRRSFILTKMRNIEEVEDAPP